MAGYSAWFWLHIGLIFAGFAGIILSVIGAILYLLQSSLLKSKHPGKIFLKLPSLSALDALHFQSLSWGLALFSLGILIGFFRAHNISEMNLAVKDPNVLLSFLACLLYWVIFSLRLSAIRRGQKIAIGTLLVFILILAMLASPYYSPSGFHRGF